MASSWTLCGCFLFTKRTVHLYGCRRDIILHTGRKDQLQTRVLWRRTLLPSFLLAQVVSSGIPGSTFTLCHGESSRCTSMHRVTLALRTTLLSRSFPLVDSLADLLQNIPAPLPVVHGEVDLRAEAGPQGTSIEDDGDEGIVFVDQRP